ncbi:HlyD family efflux transporter periplasmic adaptor subunit [Nibribacter ruber]|uniref:HlyD family efflux transporter periplasmic adaptor subunit n=1 Tax=Nibribacter ruber TaxID=2698458 RepID=A0A6P1NS55_9BACT|nr:HlyD family secretion protein [Nibribacter ruber]QHL86507.1 HlyD family efflux transporter periplasmic adaptor subunit [Nibribacter ruber]
METQKKKSNKVIPIILGLVLVIGGFFGIKEYLYYSKHVDTDDAQIDADISPVVSRVSGYVDTIMFEENTHVTQGQVLVKLDDRDYAIKVEQAMAAQHGASASTGVNQAQITATAASATTAKANIEATRVRLWKAQQDFNRYANLIKDGSITQQQFDQAKADRDVAQANYQAAQDQYRAAQQQVNTTRTQLTVSNTGVDQRQADVDFAKLQMSYTTLTAPASGIVSKKSVQKGQLVQAGQALFSIVNDNSIYVTANFKETQLEKIREGQKVNIEVDAFPEEKVEGQIYNFSPATGAKFSLLPPDNATGNFVKVVQRVPVKIKITASPELMKRLRPGMSVKASVLTND